MNNFRYLFITFLCLFLSKNVISQAENDSIPKVTAKNKSRLADKLVFGGNIGASFGTNTYIEVSPMIGYKITKSFISGINLNYIYVANRFQSGSVYGPGVFARYLVTPEFFVHTEYQYSIVDLQAKNSSDEYHVEFPMLLLGGGYFMSLGGRSRLGVSILYDVIEDPNNYRRNPIIRGGVSIGI